MGGKTQQRVSGNAKPSNSGRIRGLLINQKVRTGNIITFSSLSTKSQQERQRKEPYESGVTIISNNEEQQTKSILTQKSVIPPARLVVRRVGDRELYTRVKFVEGDDTQDEGQLPQFAVQSSDAGVKKPSPGFLEQTCPLPTNEAPLNDESASQQNEESSSGLITEEELVEEDPDDKLDFDGVLTRLEGARILVAQTKKPSSLNEIDEHSINNELDLLKLLSILTRKYISDTSIDDWDMIGNVLEKWVSWILKTNFNLCEKYQINFCVQVFRYINSLKVCAESAKQLEETSESSTWTKCLLENWNNLLASSMFLDFVSLFLKLVATENQDQSISTATSNLLIEELACIILSLDPKVVMSHHELFNYLSTKVEFDQEFDRPSNSFFCEVDGKLSNNFKAICGLLRSNSRVILITSHAILSRTMSANCVNSQVSTLLQDHDVVDDVLLFPPEPLMAILTSRDSMMSALLSDYRVGDISVTIEPNTDSYACTLSYLFAWDLIIQYLFGVDKEVGQCIIHSLKKLNFIQRLLDFVFILLPPIDDRTSLHFRIDSSDRNGDDENNHDWTIDQFLKSPLKTTIKRPVNEIELVALHLYFSIASKMPVTARKWYNNNANKRLCNLVNEYTVKHISRVICSLEMESVQEKCHQRANKDESKNLIIKARPSAKEVYAIYTRDEFKMELTIKLPQNYPLGPVQIDGGKRVGVTDVKWRSWLLQLTTFLSHQNGPILDGIDLWQRNIDKRFEGVEKCTICFSILHSNYQLPKKKCQTCANMFHNLCLYKWFESSGNSTCPLCRNPW